MNQTVYDVVQERHNMVAARMREVNDELIYTALFGSQNYKMDTANSDVDVHCMYAQHPERIVTQSTVHYPLIEGDLAYDGHADVKTVHDMLVQYRKGNLNFLETLWTPYIAVTPGWEWFVHCLRKNRDLFLTDHHHLFITWGGFVRQMISRTTRRSARKLMGPEANTLTGWREDLGYNPKAFANALRIKETMIRFKNGREFSWALWMGDYAKDLIEIKQGSLPLEEVEKMLIDLDAWLAKFLLVEDNDYKREMEQKKDLKVDMRTQDFCTSLEMEAFAKMWHKFEKPEGYLKFS